VPSESDLHRSIFARSAGLSARFPRILLGPGDDCAAIHAHANPSRPLFLTVDQLVEGRHFAPIPRTSIDLIARKAIARSVSDIAAMAGSPAFALATGLLPPNCPYADELCERLAHWALHFRCPLIGGDIASSSADAPCPLVLTTTLIGDAHPARGPVTRSGAQRGDDVYVTGRLGNSFASGRHLTFEPRVREAIALADALGPDLHAMLDISDGLGRDAARIAEASHFGIALEAAAVPLHADVSDPLRALSDGEDYELLFTARAGAPVPHQLPASLTGAPPTPVTRIGRVVEHAAGPRCTVLLPDGRVLDASAMGWEHP
jgi:thiamine-monophosphate kinase